METDLETIAAALKKQKDEALEPCSKCDEPAPMRFEGGLPVGHMCLRCFSDMVAECRSRSW